MNKLPPNFDPPEDVDDRYRRASSVDPSRPSETVRRAVLAYAEQLTRERAATKQVRWRPAILGTLAAAVLAGLMIAPRYLALQVSPAAQEPSARARPAAAPPAPAVPTPDVLADEHVPSSPAPAFRIPPKAGGSPATVRVPSHLSRARSQLQAKESVEEGPVSAAAAPVESPLSGGVQASAETGKSEPESRQEPISAAAVASITAARARATEAQGATPGDSAAAFRRAAETGDLSVLEALRQKQSNIDSRDQSGRTALMLATLHGQANAVSALLAYGADPNAADADGIRPLQAALAGHQPEIVAMLRRYGAR